MINKSEDILVLHPSPIVFYGLCKAIQMAGLHGNIVHVDSFSEMKIKLGSGKFSMVFVSPFLVVNLTDQLYTMQKEYNLKVVALVSGFQPNVLSQSFDDKLSLDDPLDRIVASIGEKKSDVRKKQNQKNSLLSGRELDVLRLLISGLSNKEIAEKLYISFHTVVSHRKNIVQKTGIKSVSGLTIYAVSNRLIDLAANLEQA